MSNTEQLVKRSRKVAFMDVSTTSIANFLRMTKFTEMSKAKNPTEYSRTYVDEDGEVTDVTGYSEEISYAFDLYKGNAVHEKIVDITDNEKTGNEALVDIVMVDFSKPVSGGTGGYEARKRKYAVIPDTEGDSTDAYTYSGAFRKNSGFTIGTATVSSDNMTATFTPELEVPEYPVTFLVKDSSDSTPIASAKITIEGNSYLTDANGIVSTDLPADTYSNINVEKEGYTAQADVEITVTNKALLKEISLVKAV